MASSDNKQRFQRPFLGLARSRLSRLLFERKIFRRGYDEGATWLARRGGILLKPCCHDAEQGAGIRLGQSAAAAHILGLPRHAAGYRLGTSSSLLLSARAARGRLLFARCRLPRRRRTSVAVCLHGRHAYFPRRRTTRYIDPADDSRHLWGYHSGFFNVSRAFGAVDDLRRRHKDERRI